MKKVGNFIERVFLTALLLMIIGIVVLVFTTKMGFKAIIIADVVVIGVLILKSLIGKLLN